MTAIMIEQPKQGVVQAVRTYKHLFSFISSRVKTVEEAEDILQDVWYQHWDIYCNVLIDDKNKVSSIVLLQKGDIYYTKFFSGFCFGYVFDKNKASLILTTLCCKDKYHNSSTQSPILGVRR